MTDLDLVHASTVSVSTLPSQALLHSMHKYFIRLVVEEERKTPPGEERLPAKTVFSMDFTETTFVAVTAYQNEEVSTCGYYCMGVYLYLVRRARRGMTVVYSIMYHTGDLYLVRRACRGMTVVYSIMYHTGDLYLR